MAGEYRPIGGLNYEAPELGLGETQVLDAVNFLFDQGTAKTRGAMANDGPFTIAGRVQFGRGLIPTGSTNYSNVLIDSTSAIYKESTALTGSAPTFEDARFHNACAVNGVILIGNNTDGAIRFDPTGTSYTILSSSSQYRYLTSHLSRAFGAFKNTSGGNVARQVGWTVSGDESNWTGTGSGSSVLADLQDEITGVATIQNVVVIIRQQGITLGYPTGQSSPAYRFETVIRQGIGCPYPESIIAHNNAIYFRGQDNIYEFTLDRGMAPIGTPIRRYIDQYVQTIDERLRFKMLVTDSETRGGIPMKNRRLHVFPYPATTAVNISGGPHFTYHFDSQTWSRHAYKFAIFGGMDYTEGAHRKLYLFDSKINPGFYGWNEGAQLEVDARLIGRPLVVGSLDQDVTLDRLLVHHRNVYDTFKSIQPNLPTAEPIGVALDNKLLVRVQAFENFTNKGVSAIADLDDLAGAPIEGWRRSWYNYRLSGQKFQYILEAKAGSVIEVDYLAGDFSGPMPMRAVAA